MDSYLIYEVVNPVNDKRYIGKTGNLKQRKAQHSKIAGYGGGFVFGRAIRKYGFETFQWNILSRHKVEADAMDAEIAAIKQRREVGIILYNMTDGGDGTSGYQPTPEQNAANSARQFGRKATDETRKRMREARAGYRHSEATKKKISTSHMGKVQGPPSDQSRQLKSAAWTDRKTSQYQGVGWSNKGYWYSRRSVAGKSHWIGSFNTELAAHNAYEQFTITG